jgi:hypothetical protein
MFWSVDCGLSKLDNITLNLHLHDQLNSGFYKEFVWKPTKILMGVYHPTNWVLPNQDVRV